MDYYGADVAFVDCLCSKVLSSHHGVLLFALCRGCYGNIGYVLYMVYERGYRLVTIIVLGTMVISSIVVMEGLEPFVKQRSNIDVVPVVDSYEGMSITITAIVFGCCVLYGS